MSEVASLPGAPPHVKLGEHDYPVYPQRHAYLANRLGKAFEDLQNPELLTKADSLAGFVMAAGDQVYELLAVFIPKLMPKYEFAGYSNQGAYEAKEYDEEYDASPEIPQIIEALQTVLRVNRLDLMSHLGGLLPMDLIKAYIGKFVAERMEASMPSPNSSSEEATSPSMSSGATPPTSPESSA